MNSIALEIVILVLLILANGLFAMAEIAVVSARKTRLRQQAEEGNKRAQAALALAEEPNQFLATVQIGITLVGILSGAFGGATLAEELAAVLQGIPLLAPYAEGIAVGVVVLAITYLSLVVGELVPKQLGLSNPERVAAAVTPFMRVLSRLTAPVVRLLSLSTDLVVRLLGAKPADEPPISDKEIEILLQEGTRAGVFEPGEEEMVSHVFRLADRTINALMTPRPNVVWLDLDAEEPEMRGLVAAAGHSRLPVARGDLDDALGLVYAKDLLAQALTGQPLDVAALVRPALFLPESISALEAVERLKESQVDAALVIDEYGVCQGLLTVNDILEAIVGDIPVPGEISEPESVQREDGSWLLDGLLSAEEVKDLLDIDGLPYEEKSYYQTLSGLVMISLGHIPVAGDRFECCGWEFEVMDMDGRRVDKVLASRVPAGEAPASEQR